MSLTLTTKAGDKVVFGPGIWEKSDYLSMLERNKGEQTDLCKVDIELLKAILETECLPTSGKQILPEDFESFEELLDYAGVYIDLEFGGHDDIFNAILELSEEVESEEDELYDEEISDDFSIYDSYDEVEIDWEMYYNEGYNDKYSQLYYDGADEF